MSGSSSQSNSSPISSNSGGSSLAAQNASPPLESNSPPPSVLPPPDSESLPPSSAPPIAPKVPPPSNSTPSAPAPNSIGSNSPPPNQSTTVPPPKIAASPPPLSSSAPPPSSPLHGPTSPPPESSPPPNLPPESKAPPPPRVVIPPAPKTPQGSPPSRPPPRGPPGPSTPDTSPPTEIMSPKKPSPSTPPDAKQVNNAAHRAPPSSPTTSSSPPTPSVIASGTGIAIGISAAVLVVALVAMLFVILRKKKKKRGIHGFVGHYKPTPDGYYHAPGDAGGLAAHKGIYHASNSPPSPTTGKSYGAYMGHGYHAGPQEPAGSRPWFTYEELTDVTNGFSRQNIIGEGGFGCVYKGNLPDGRQVAVKQLKARPLLVHVLETGGCGELVDPRLENNFAKSEMLKMIEAAAACVRHSATKRPRMVQVLRALDSEGNLVDLSNGVKFGQSTVYDSAQYSTDIEKFRKMAFKSDIYGSSYDHSGESED
ncbi:hypothetical protein COCNU_06G007310 [Cocos nucifera]|uniref:non-specific serine/threonine protein kinase n=1 Tax=Cocos nucifera TaxID=13894 RepID=A0A8K0IBP0_COCNU|nr:hypothetical protein COCNU_06G007310 [Cocos nucifera]